MFPIQKRDPRRQLSVSDRPEEPAEVSTSTSPSAGQTVRSPRLNSPVSRAAVIPNATRAKVVKQKNFTFGRTIKVDVDVLQNAVKNSREFNYAPLEANNTLDPLPRNEKFKHLLERAVEEFSADLEPMVLQQIKPGGKIYNYCLGARSAEQSALLKPLNNFFGMLKVLDTEKRKDGLNALLTLPDNDLNCVAGMVERIHFIQNALNASNNFATHIYAEAEQKLIASKLSNSERYGIDIHHATQLKNRILHDPVPSDKIFIQEKTAKSVKEFLEKDVQRVVGELVNIINRSTSMEAKADAIKKCHEQYLPSLNWFFPPQHEGALSDALTAQPSSQLHQHAPYFELNDTYDNFINVEQGEIVCDALKAAQPVLSSQSKILILKENPAFWPVLSKIFFPSIAQAHPNLSQAEFFDKILYSKLLPELVDKDENLLALFSENAVSLDRFFEKEDGLPSLPEKIVLKNPVSPAIEILYMQCKQLQRGDLIEKLEGIAGIDEGIVTIKNLCNLAPISAQNIQENSDVIFNKFNQLKSPEVQNIVAKNLSIEFNNTFDSLRDRQKLSILSIYSHFLSSSSLTNELLATLLKGLLKNIKPAENRQQRMIHSEIIKLVSEKTDGMEKSKLGECAIDVILDLAHTMGNLHAATLRNVPSGIIFGEMSKSQDPQTLAYKVIKRRLEQCTKDPQATLRLVQALWNADTIHNLSTSTRTLAAKHWKKIITSAVTNTALYAGTNFLADALSAVIDAEHFAFNADLADFNRLSDITHQLNAYKVQLQPAIENTQNLLNQIEDGSFALKSAIDEAYGSDFATGNNIIQSSLDRGRSYPVNELPSLPLEIDNLDTSNLSLEDQAIANDLKNNLYEIQKIDKEALPVLLEYNNLYSGPTDVVPFLDPIVMGVEHAHVPEIVQYAPAAIEGAYILGRKVPDVIESARKKATGEFATWGPVGGVRTAVTLAKAIHSKPLASIQHAAVRLTPPTLIHLRKATLPDAPQDQAEHMRSLNTTWCAVLAQVNRPRTETPPMAASTASTASVHDVPANAGLNNVANATAEIDASDTSPPANISIPTNIGPGGDLPLTARSLILSSYIKEFNQANFPNVPPEELALAKKEGLNEIAADQLHALLPRLYGHSKVAYLELSEHLLLNSNAATASLTQHQINDIANKLDGITNTAGKMSRLQASLTASKVRYALVPAWLRLDLGIVKGRGRRTQAVKNARQAGLEKIVQKQTRITNAVEKLAQANAALALSQPTIDRQRLNDSSARFFKKWKKPSV